MVQNGKCTKKQQYLLKPRTHGKDGFRSDVWNCIIEIEKHPRKPEELNHITKKKNIMPYLLNPDGALLCTSSKSQDAFISSYKINASFFALLVVFRFSKIKQTS